MVVTKLINFFHLQSTIKTFSFFSIWIIVTVSLSIFKIYWRAITGSWMENFVMLCMPVLGCISVSL